MLAAGVVLACSVALALADPAAPAAEEPKSAVCKDYPHLNLCNIQGVLAGALEELEVLLGDDDEPETAGAPMAKRKSAFVRFGKRKSAFVRFGRSAGAPEDKRKSSYIRFGRK